MLDECECGHVRLAHDYNGCLMGGDQWDCECKHFRPAVSPDRCPARALAAAPSEEIGGLTCVGCGQPATRDDADGEPLCERHYQHLLDVAEDTWAAGCAIPLRIVSAPECECGESPLAHVCVASDCDCTGYRPRASVDAREAERLRKEVEAWRWAHWGHPEASWACPCGFVNGFGLNQCAGCSTWRPMKPAILAEVQAGATYDAALVARHRASLRATPPETTTQETKP
jgi:hypothetical protein